MKGGIMPKIETASFEQVLAEHEELRKWLAQLRGFLAEPRPEILTPGYHTWAATLSRKLR